MSRRTIQVGSVLWTISSDDPAPAGDRLWSLVGAGVTDELTGQPPVSELTVSSNAARSVPRVAQAGLLGAAGIPRRSFPRLAAQNYAVELQIDAERFVSRTVSIPVPQDLTFPATFSPPPLANVALHRQPTVIRGRVTQVVANNI